MKKFQKNSYLDLCFSFVSAVNLKLDEWLPIKVKKKSLALRVLKLSSLIG